MTDERPFELRVVPFGERDYGVALFERPTPAQRNARPKSISAGQQPAWRQLVAVQGAPFHAIVESVMGTLRRAGYRPSDLCRTRKAPFALPEPEGVRLGLLMLAVKPLRKSERMDAIARQIAGMGDEEEYYWFSKGTSAEIARRAQKAFRHLLAKE